MSWFLLYSNLNDFSKKKKISSGSSVAAFLPIRGARLAVEVEITAHGGVRA